MKTKTIRRQALFALTGVSLLAAAVSAQADNWRGWNIHPDGYPNTVALEAFAEAVKEQTEGRVTPVFTTMPCWVISLMRLSKPAMVRWISLISIWGPSDPLLRKRMFSRYLSYLPM